MFFKYKYFYLNWKSNKEYKIQWLNEKPLIFNYEYEAKIKKEKLIFIGNIEYKFKTPNKLNKIDYWCYNNSFLKSHLQKCVRRGYTQKAICTAFILMENNICDFLRRLPIIILEDVYLIEDYDVLIWFMVMSTKIKIPETAKMWLLYIVKSISECPYLNYYEYLNEFKPETDIHTISIDKLSNLYAIFIRIAYGGLKGDILMMNYLLNNWQNVYLTEKKTKKKNYIKPISICFKNIYIKNIMYPNEYELSGIDFIVAEILLTLFIKN